MAWSKIINLERINMAILTWILIGGFAGWVASMIMGRDAQMGIAANIIVGILGALIGGWLVTLFGGPNVDISSFSFTSFAVAVLGAVVLLGIVRAVQPPVTGRM
jgi:uncharacterized membrane protein YeaQ/YmgE (transglycosylase-associated protein family)